MELASFTVAIYHNPEGVLVGWLQFEIINRGVTLSIKLPYQGTEIDFRNAKYSSTDLSEEGVKDYISTFDKCVTNFIPKVLPTK